MHMLWDDCVANACKWLRTYPRIVETELHYIHISKITKGWCNAKIVNRTRESNVLSKTEGSLSNSKCKIKLHGTQERKEPTSILKVQL